MRSMSFVGGDSGITKGDEEQARSLREAAEDGYAEDDEDVHKEQE